MMITDDSTAISVLKVVAQAQLRIAATELNVDRKLGYALAIAFDTPINQTAASEGDLARAALALLAQDPAFAEPIRLMTAQASASQAPQRYFEPSSIALTTAVLLALQTRIKFKVDQSGKWSIEVDKKSAGDTALKLVVQRLLPFLNK